MAKLYFRKMLLGIPYGIEFYALYAFAAIALNDFAQTIFDSENFLYDALGYFLLLIFPFLITVATATVFRFRNEDAADNYKKGIGGKHLSLKEDVISTIKAPHFQAEVFAFGTYIAVLAIVGARLFWYGWGFLGILMEIGWFLFIVLVYSVFNFISWRICHKIW